MLPAYFETHSLTYIQSPFQTFFKLKIYTEINNNNKIKKKLATWEHTTTAPRVMNA